ncbi:MAG: ABC transporter ATP-binding protein [Eubacteriales bacterium]|nr:ABC transporter ATP-binding protein/permease [Clostridiales bacterium]MDD6932781.1 ABC transporter ATP-binding protein [Eubacteriales bacterium]MDY2601175.1 ABC transporter ATP-binding protein [Eubacteriales bacterium]
MKRKFSYSILEMNCRLLAIGRPIRKYIVISTLASIFGALAHMGLMGFGALWLLAAAGYCRGTVIYAALTVLCAALISLCRYLEGVFSHQGAYGILAKMRVHLFDAIDRVSPAYLIGRETGDVMNVAVSDIETLEFFFAHTIGPMFTVILLPVTTVVLAWRVSPLYAWVLIPIYILISIVLPLIALKAGRGIGMRYRERLGTLKSKILESVYSIRDIQIFGAGPRKMQEVAEANRQVNRAALGLTLHRQTIASLPSFFVSLARILILVCAGVLASRGADDPVGTVAVSFAATASLSSTFNLTFVVTSLLEAYAAAERIFKIEDALPETEEPAHSTPCGEIETIEFRDVSFAYPHTDRQILEHFSYVIHKGDRIGIAGESGVGKSTILRLLLRFYAPSSGGIYINGVPLEQISFAELHRRIAFLEQDTYLFNATIAENIALSRPEATMDEIRAAAEKAGVAEFIDTLPEGYQTDMGQMSARLSGGERQRIGIARILLRNPDVCLMDEPSSALDALHEKELLHTLQTAYAGKTLMLISHRASTLTGCDRILKITPPQK